MPCPCVMVGFVGGWIGEYITGYRPPNDTKGKIISYCTTSTLVGLTFIALKKIWNIPMCGGATSLLGRTSIVLVKGILLGVIYSIGVNYLLGKFYKGSCCHKMRLQGS